MGGINIKKSVALELIYFSVPLHLMEVRSSDLLTIYTTYIEKRMEYVFFGEFSTAYIGASLHIWSIG